jgi:hypothetical protein
MRNGAMIELVIVYCLSNDTKICVEKRLRMEDFSSPVGCTMSGQQRAQAYLRDHPAYHLKSWRCEVNLPRQTNAWPDRDDGTG